MYILDTDICIYALNGSSPAVLERIASVQAAELKTTAVNAAELFFGARRSGRPERNLARVETFLAPLELLPFDEQAAVIHSEIREQLVSAGTPIGPHDMLIAAIALAVDAILVTNNTAEFERISTLALENWTIPT